jgi:hypothetical protein
VSDHHHYGYADERHDHRGQYADDRHDHDGDYAEKYHRHYDDESTARGLREDLGHAEARIRELEDDLRDALNRIHVLEDRLPDYASPEADDEDQADERLPDAPDGPWEDQAIAAADDEAWGGRGPSASYAEWLAEGREEAGEPDPTFIGSKWTVRPPNERGEVLPQRMGGEAGIPDAGGAR